MWLFKYLGSPDVPFRIAMHRIAKEFSEFSPKDALRYEIHEYLNGKVSIEYLQDKIKEADSILSVKKKA